MWIWATFTYTKFVFSGWWQRRWIKCRCFCRRTRQCFHTRNCHATRSGMSNLICTIHNQNIVLETFSWLLTKIIQNPHLPISTIQNHCTFFHLSQAPHVHKLVTVPKLLMFTSFSCSQAPHVHKLLTVRKLLMFLIELKTNYFPNACVLVINRFCVFIRFSRGKRNNVPCNFWFTFRKVLGSSRGTW